MKTITSLRALAVLGTGIAFAPHTAQAQGAAARDQSAPANEGAIDSVNNIIVVTGTKGQNPEDVQDVPLAVTAFNAQSLEALKVRDVQSLSYSAPNVSLDQIGTSRGQANFSVRGLGVNSSIPSIDPTVGVFVDGVYLGFNGGVVFDLFDLDSVEILRGPQGILFGRNTTGGAVLINTGNPTEEFSGKFRTAIDGPFVDGGRGGGNYTLSSVVSGPVAEDLLLFKLGAYYNKDEGYFTNLFDNANHGRAETTILRGALEFRPDPDLTILAKLDYFDSEGDGPAAQNHGTFRRDTFDFAIDNRGSYTSEIWTGSIRADWDIGPGTLTNILGFRDYSNTTNGDIDALPTFIFHSNTATEQDQFSNELRYAIATDSFDLTLGGFYFDQSIAYDEDRDIVGSPLSYGGGAQDHEVLGVFGQAKFNLTDALSLIAGLRWSREEKDARVTYVRRRPQCSVIAMTCPTTGINPFSTDPAFAALFPGGSENNGFSDKQSWTNWSPKLGVQYDYGNGQFYGHWTRGYRSGGYNFRITSPTVFEAIAQANGSFAFDEERVDSFEIGGKFQSFGGAFTLNAAAYVTKIDNLQREVNQSSPGQAGSGVAQSIFNTANATITGFEAEARMRVDRNLLFTANLGLIDDDYDTILFDITGDGMIDDADLALRLPRVPEITVGFGILHELYLGSSTITTRANYQFRDEFAYTDNNFGYITDADNLDANVTWETPVEGLSFSVYGKNLLDTVQHGGDTQLPFGNNGLGNGVDRPFDFFPKVGTFSPLSKGRQVGAEVTFAF